MITCFLNVLFVVLLPSQVNSYGHGGTFSSPNHTFFLGKLEPAVNQYFAHILSQPFLNESAEGWRMIVEMTSSWDQSPRKYGTEQGSTSRSLDMLNEIGKVYLDFY